MQSEPEKARRRLLFQDTMDKCQTHPTLMDAVQRALAEQRFIAADEVRPAPPLRYDAPCAVTVTRSKSFEAARAHWGKSVCVLNFASAVSPGGGVAQGFRAQEEDLCRTSTLYPCLMSPAVRQPFHDTHRQLLADKQMDPFYNDDCILTPHVVIFKDDEDRLLPEEDWQRVSILTCAAPNLRWFDELPSESKLAEVFAQRWRRILSVGAQSGAEVLILGAFGCGDFRNSPELVAQSVRQELPAFAHAFRTVEFAVYSSSADSPNFKAFSNIMNGF